MASPRNFIAIDLGASSGRVIRAAWDDRRVSLHEVHRFPNGMLHMPDRTAEGRWCWDVWALWREIEIGLRKAAVASPHAVVSVGVDSWGVDYALIGKSGRLLAPPSAYRDPRNPPSMDRVVSLLGRSEIYAATGIQFLPFNSIYQLAADAQEPDRLVAIADKMLMIPDLFHFWLTGTAVAEHTNASTTQLYDARKRAWIDEFCRRLDIPSSLLPPVVDAGSRLGPLRSEIMANTGLAASVQVVAPATHDTGSAVVGTPLKDPLREAYLSSGTWSLLGVELTDDRRTADALAANFTNEAGAYGRTRFLTNRAGMWLIQECQRHWEAQGSRKSFEELVMDASRVEPLSVLIDPDDAQFATPGKMPIRIQEFCANTQQPVPSDPPAIVRCILDSLALRYRETLRSICRLTDRHVDTIRIVGGGAHNDLLNQLTASATECFVTAGPTEATALGNALVQMISAGVLSNVDEARMVVRESFAPREYSPDALGLNQERWDQAADRLQRISEPPAV